MLRNNLNKYKMNRDELLKILQKETSGFDSQSRLRDDVLDALEKVQELAISVTQCCEEVCEHKSDEVLHQGNGFIYKTCADCGEDL
jgi:hypothetical protein